MTPPEDEYDPFNPEPNPEEDKRSLFRSLELAQNFALLFAVCNSTDQRNALMDETEQHVAPKRVWRVPVTTEVANLFHLFQETVPETPFDMVFVYGLENWLSGAVRPRSIPLLRNLNAARDAFPLVTDCPIVFFIPQYVLGAIADAAPDFFSVRSGIFVFPLTEDERAEMAQRVADFGPTDLISENSMAKETRIQEMKGLLSEIRSLPEHQRSWDDEAFVLNRLGITYAAMGNYDAAEDCFDQALRIYKRILPDMHPHIAGMLNNLANTNNSRNLLNVAENQYRQALTIFSHNIPQYNPDYARTLYYIGSLCRRQNRLSEAEELISKAVQLQQTPLQDNEVDIAASLLSLGIVYALQNKFTEAENSFREALRIRRNELPENHPDIAVTLFNLSILYVEQGRLAEAEALATEAVQIATGTLGEDHERTRLYRANLERIRERMKVGSATTPRFRNRRTTVSDIAREKNENAATH